MTATQQIRQLHWHLDNDNDRELLRRQAVQIGLHGILEILDTMLWEYDPAEMSQAADFLTEVRDSLVIAIDNKINEMRDLAAGGGKK